MSNKKEPLYFGANEELCYPLEYHLSEAAAEGCDRVVLYPAVPTTVQGMYWCRHYENIMTDGDCGRHCGSYQPRNGVSGMCRHRSNVLYEKGEAQQVSMVKGENVAIHE